jgi:hypothetical protein
MLWKGTDAADSVSFGSGCFSQLKEYIYTLPVSPVALRMGDDTIQEAVS